MKVCFDTFGCRLNKAEALQTEAEYLAEGWTLTDRHADADVIVVRGCSVTGRAQRECERLVAHLKKHYPTKRLIVEGCLKNHEGVHRLKRDSTALPTRTARAYLKAQDGCNGRCTFCVVPSFRGKSLSMPFDGLLDRARRFIDAGYHELVLTGCNLALYAANGKHLPDLLSALAGLSPDCRIRLGSVEPGACALETVHAIAEHTNVCRFLHLPFQSGSASVLTAMRRPYKLSDVENIVKTASGLMPGIALGCDLMTGFPGETEFDFLATFGFFKRLAFTNAHVFPYSERPDTAAARMPNAIPRELRAERARLLVDAAAEKSRLFARRFAGKTVEVIVENEKDLSGWTSERLWCSLSPAFADKKANLAPMRKKPLRYRVTNISASGRLLGVPLLED